MKVLPILPQEWPAPLKRSHSDVESAQLFEGQSHEKEPIC